MKSSVPLPDSHSSTLDSLLDDRFGNLPMGLPPRSTSTTAIVGMAVLVLVLIWTSFFERSYRESSKALAAASNLDATLAAALGQYTVRVLKTAEAVTHYVGREWERGTRDAALTQVLDDRFRNNDVFSALAVLDREGRVLAHASGFAQFPDRVPLESFRRSDERGQAAVHLGESQVLEPNGPRAVTIARPVGGTGATAEAVVVAFVDVGRFLAVFESARVAPDSMILLTSPDGTVRSRWSPKHTVASPLARVHDMPGLIAADESGEETTGIDGEPRIVGVWPLPGYPLVAVVGTRVSDELAEIGERRVLWFWVRVALSALAVFAGVTLVRTNRRRDRLESSLQRARARLRSSNATLEAKVAARTAQLEEANRELQLFSSAVAHDVRAPLSTIDGFSAQLEPAIAATGDERLVRYLSRIRASSRHMSDLTEALLVLARLSERGLKFEEVDLSALAHSIVQSLRERESPREVTVDIEPGMRTVGDPVLMRQALENLLGNAWKFTSRTPSSRIVFASKPPQNGMRSYFVSDNGAGFDADYSGKLFKPFHRLHAQDEFAGTGVGLAIVQRVIALHGGKVSADGAPDKGATFFFTLPQF